MSIRSSSTNCIVLEGKIGRSAELKKSAQGTPYLIFSIAFPEFQRNLATGDVEIRDSFIDCILYGDRAAPYDGELSKGVAVTVQGRLHWDKYYDSYSNDNSRYVIRVDHLSYNEGDGDAHQG